MRTEKEHCSNCGKSGMRIIHVSRNYSRGSELLVIENVPVISCPVCGESYLTAATLRELDKIKRNRSKVASTRPSRRDKSGDKSVCSFLQFTDSRL
ncbi:MAG: type II toxin-antitoxin system MqsA family antitoxin [Pyrinomonadaceae bacterium]